MTQKTLQALRNGELNGATRLDLQANLTELPQEVFALADTLEILNITGNQLTDLPHQLANLKKLKVLFCSNNPFRHVPEVISECPALSMVGFKACQIEHVDANALPKLLRWLILTDNQINTLPDNIGEYALLQKCMLAGNQLSSLPESLLQCSNLELLRISANQFNTLPEWLFKLPRLAWLAFAGNPMNRELESHAITHSAFPHIDWQTITLQHQLGEGASGIIHQATWLPDNHHQPKQVAVKLFKGSVTSDGLPESEMAAFIAAKQHPALTAVEGIIHRHPAQTKGIVMALIGENYQILANPPSLASCTRDVYDNKTLTAHQIIQIALHIAQAVQHLHKQGLIHGDLYAHNILYDSSGESLLSDFGGASFIPDEQHAAQLQRVEVRAYGYLLEELIQLHGNPQDAIIIKLRSIATACLQESLNHRPLLNDIVSQLSH